MNHKKRGEIDFKYNFKIYLEFLLKYKKTMLLILFLILLNEGINTLNKFLFKEIVDRGTGYLSGNIALDVLIRILLIVAIIFLSGICIQAVCRWVDIDRINYLETNMIFDMKKKYFGHLIHLDYNFHTTHKRGSLIARLLRGASAIERMDDFIAFNILPLLFQLILTASSLIYLDLAPALVILVVAGVFISYSLILQQMQRKSIVQANNAEDIEKANVSDIFTNIESIKYFGKEEAIKQKYGKISGKTKEAYIDMWDYSRWFDSGQSVITGIGLFFLIYFPLMDFIHGKITLGTLTFIYTIYGGVMGPLFNFVHGVRGFYRSMADFQSLFQYGKLKNEIKDLPNAEELEIRDGKVEFKNISFNYNKRHLFRKFQLVIPPHKKVALVGHSGSGKSTLVKLLYRLYDVCEGEILIDGKNINQFQQESLRSGLSIVPQECVLFDDTIYNNVAFSDPHAPHEKVMEAIKLAQLDRIIAHFPHKEKTIVGERGVKLSGGEKQRVSIARAILADKRILVLDEATSSLDSETERDIQIALGKLMENRTTIIIAHRLSTIMKADTIVVLDEGKIVQMGNHQQLIKQSGQYQKLWELQKGGYIK